MSESTVFSAFGGVSDDVSVRDVHSMILGQIPRDWKITDDGEIVAQGSHQSTLDRERLAAESSNRVILYGLVDEREPGRVRYVGQTTLPLHRLDTHAGGSTQVGKWIAQLLDEGSAVQMGELGSCAAVYASMMEAALIRMLRLTGQADLNVGTPHREICPVCTKRQLKHARFPGTTAPE